MKWQGREQSSNIEDRRAEGGGGFGGGLGRGGFGSNPFGTGGGQFRLPSGRSGTSLGGLGETLTAPVTTGGCAAAWAVLLALAVNAIE